MANKKLSFEDAVKKLQKASDDLKSGNLSLEESTAVYEDSLKYYEAAKSILQDARQKIEIYKPDTEEIEDFETNE